MPVEYIAPNTANPAHVYDDSPLTPDMAVAKRRVDNRSKPAFTFQVDNHQDFDALLEILSQIKSNGAVGHPQLMATPSFKSFVRQGYIDNKGQPLNGFDAQIKGLPAIEILYKTGGNHYAVFTMSEKGAAYIDSKGTACPNNQIDPKDSNATFQNYLRSRWAQFYDKGQDATLIQKSVHFHQGVKQQEDTTHDSLDWCLANLQVLAGDIHADESKLKAAKKQGRDALVKAVNGQQIPNDLSNTYQLTYKPESLNAAGKKRRRKQLDEMVDRHGKLHTEAVQLWRNRKTVATAPWVKVCISPPPEYREGSNLNEYNTARQDGMKNTFKINEKNGLEATSSGGKVSYEERFLRMAEDLSPIFKDDLGNVIHVPVVINSIDPPEEEAACLKAFETVFGVGNVEIKQPDKDDSLGNGFSASPL